MPAHDPTDFARHYRQFRVTERLLLTGHSHQAWPDVALRGQAEAFEAAALDVDDKWQLAFEKAAKVKGFFADRLGCDAAELALGPAVHDLLVRLLSALPLRARPHIVTTDGEFHSVRRQLDRLGEEGVEVVKVPLAPLDSLALRLADALDERCAAVIVSAVGYSTGVITEGLGTLAEAASRLGVACVVDAYHALNVVDVDLATWGLDSAFILGGGYKYAQMGEGNAFLRVPPGTSLRPAVTGWFAEFALLDHAMTPGRVDYSPGADAFGGSTYDPTSHFRAAAVADFWRDVQLDSHALREISQRQIGRLVTGLQQMDLPKHGARLTFDVPLHRRAGFVGIEHARAGELAVELRRHDLWVDARANTLRLGPAPYVSDAQLDQALAILANSW